jgi:hypothetical protein
MQAIKVYLPRKYQLAQLAATIMCNAHPQWTGATAKEAIKLAQELLTEADIAVEADIKLQAAVDAKADPGR